MRRFRNDWRKPDLLLIDGGLPQVNAVQQVIHHLNLGIPVIGIAKGPERKRNDVICGSTRSLATRGSSAPFPFLLSPKLISIVVTFSSFGISLTNW
jgi:excinuclease UvrABC nuclease subunit